MTRHADESTDKQHLICTCQVLLLLRKTPQMEAALVAAVASFMKIGLLTPASI